jgi:hypothetical protein
MDVMRRGWAVSITARQVSETLTAGRAAQATRKQAMEI